MIHIVNVSASNNIKGDGICQIAISSPTLVDSDLKVRYRVGGTAVQGIHYKPIPVYSVIPKGKAAIFIDIEPIDLEKLRGTESIIVYLLPDDGYKIGAQSSALSTVTENNLVRYPFKDTFGQKRQETSYLTLNGMQARIIEMELFLYKGQTVIEELQTRVAELERKLDSGG
jgi:hypothetical protein